MKNCLLHIVLLLSVFNTLIAQVDDGVVALDLPVRNSLTFNRYAIHPTFSIVREQNKYITATNKREYLGVDDAPNMYLVSFSGRLNESMGASLGLFQQNYGVLTTFGGILNYAYNVRIQEDSNFAFGINVGAYQSGINNGNININFDDPALNNYPSNFILTTSPGINYGTGFLDFGISYNNLVSYNLNSSGILENNPKKGFQGQILYTGYIGGYGFFSESKFSALAISEFQKEETLLSGAVMLTVPKGIWAQVGYHTQYGFSGGLGINISPQIAIEYNYEKSLGDLSTLGASHEITLAYRFKNNNYYDYGGNDEVAGVFSFENKPQNKKKSSPAASTTAATVAATTTNNENEEAKEQARLQAEEEVRITAEEQSRLKAEEEARITAEEQSRLQAEEEARIAAEEQSRLQAEEEARIATEEQARLQAEEEARIAAEEQARLQAEEEARITAEEQVKLQEEVLINPSDEIGKSLSDLTQETEAESTNQSQLIEDLEAAVAVKEFDLQELKKENDLSEQNIYVEPRPFKSIQKENEAIELLKINLDTVILRQKKKIAQIERLLKERETIISDPNDEINQYYQNKLGELKSQQEKYIRTRDSLLVSLEQISVATDIERKRRIKRAAYDNDQDRYAQDRAQLERLKESVSTSNTSIDPSQLDFGRERNSNIQIIKNVKNIESGYYLVMAVHSNVQKRDVFISQVLASGNKNIDFFFDVNSSEYYIYSQKYNDINATERALKNIDNKPYNSKVNIVKIENE